MKGHLFLLVQPIPVLEKKRKNKKIKPNQTHKYYTSSWVDKQVSLSNINPLTLSLEFNQGWLYSKIFWNNSCASKVQRQKLEAFFSKAETDLCETWELKTMENGIIYHLVQHIASLSEQQCYMIKNPWKSKQKNRLSIYFSLFLHMF